MSNQYLKKIDTVSTLSFEEKMMESMQYDNDIDGSESVFMFLGNNQIEDVGVEELFSANTMYDSPTDDVDSIFTNFFNFEEDEGW